MDLETVAAEDFGKSLSGIGINLLSRDVIKLSTFLVEVFGAKQHRVSADFAIVTFNGTMMQIHSDATFAKHPLHAMLPENPPRGTGTQFYMFGADPDTAVAKAESFGGTLIETPSDKPHGLYEGTVLCPDGYAFTAAIPSMGA